MNAVLILNTCVGKSSLRYKFDNKICKCIIYQRHYLYAHMFILVDLKCRYSVHNNVLAIESRIILRRTLNIGSLTQGSHIRSE